MKKFLLFGFAAAITLASCTTNDEVLDTTMQTPMEFGSFVNKGTKAPITNANITNSKFGVFGYKYKTSIQSPVATDFVPVFQNVPVWHNGTAWTYEDATHPLRYWDKTCRYDFYAYAPIEKGVNVTYSKLTEAKLLVFNNFEVSDTASAVSDTNTDPTKYLEHTDLLIADALENRTNYGSPQQFTFRHILTNVSINVRKAAGFAGEVKFTSAVLNGIKNKSLYYMHVFSKKADIAAQGGWYFDPSDASNHTANFTSAQTPTEVITEGGIPLYTEMLMIPQEIAANTFDIAYTINGETFTKTLSFAGTWEANQKITYNIEISASAIEFDVTTVEDWETEGNTIPSTID